MTQLNSFVKQIQRAALCQDLTSNADGDLLEAFVRQKNEVAFETLVRRHGSMVFGVCRRITRNHQDAEDAFQATFVVLAHKAASIKPRGMVANWLYGVAYRTALKAKALSSKRLAVETSVAEIPDVAAPSPGEHSDFIQLIDQEINELAEKYRIPILLCDLEGKSIKEATQQLGWPQGTLAGRLARGRKLLGKRLKNRGVVCSVSLFSTIATQNSISASNSTALFNSTIKCAVHIVAEESLAFGSISPNVAVLIQGIVKMMTLSKLKSIVVVLCVVLGLVISGGGFLEIQKTWAQLPKDKNAENPPAKKEEIPSNIKMGQIVKEMSKPKFNLPRGPFPVHGMIKLASDKKSVSVQTLKATYYSPTLIDADGEKFTVFIPRDEASTTKYASDSVKAFVVLDEKLKKIEVDQFDQYMKDGSLGLVFPGGLGIIDDRNFRLIKDGTVVLYLPLERAPDFYDKEPMPVGQKR